MYVQLFEWHIILKQLPAHSFAAAVAQLAATLQLMEAFNYAQKHIKRNKNFLQSMANVIEWSNALSIM